MSESRPKPVTTPSSKAANVPDANPTIKADGSSEPGGARSKLGDRADGDPNPGRVQDVRDIGHEPKEDRRGEFVRHPLDDMAEFEQSLRGKSEEEKKAARERRRMDAKPPKGQSGMEVGRPRYRFVGGVEAPAGVSIGDDVWAFDAGPGLTVYCKPVGKEKEGTVLIPLSALVKVEEQG